MKILSTIVAMFVSVGYGQSLQQQLGLVDINGKNLYVEYTKPFGQKPTLIVVNGLTYSTRNWSASMKFLKQKGYGVLLFDLQGMGTTLLSNSMPTSPILYRQQVADIKALVNKLKIKAPYNMVGLSYGGGIIAAYAAEFPKDIGNLILIAPYTEFLETQKNWIKDQIQNTRVAFPHNPASDEELTDYFIRQLVYTTYPAAEISSVENPWKLEGITRLVQGIRMYQPIHDAKKIPKRSLHLVLAEQDQYIPKAVFEKYWNAVPLSSRASRTKVRYSEHKLPEAFPRFVGQFIMGVLEGQPLLFKGETLEANPVTMEIKKVP